MTLKFACTGHKAQGATIKNVFVTDFGRHKSASTGWLYVVLSRVKSITNIFLVDELDTHVDNFAEMPKVSFENERLLMMSPVEIVDIWLDGAVSCQTDLHGLQLFERIVAGDFVRGSAPLNALATQQRLFALIEAHCYANIRRKREAQQPSTAYVHQLFAGVVEAAVVRRRKKGAALWLHRSELKRLKLKQLRLAICDVSTRKPGVLLKRHAVDAAHVRFVREFEFEVQDAFGVDAAASVVSDDFEYALDAASASRMSFFFELSRSCLGCSVWLSLIALPADTHTVLVQCAVFCEDLAREVRFEPVWASQDCDNIGGVLLDASAVRQLQGVSPLTLNITLRVLQTSAVRSPAKSILANFQATDSD